VRATHVSVLPNGVDLPDDESPAQAPEPDSLVFVGTMHYDPNAEGLRWFLDRVWPRVRQLRPAARLRVVGRNADQRNLPFACRTGVELVGQVPQVHPYFHQAAVSIVPLLSGMGTRIKILESLACGRPVVATHIGAEGLNDLDQSHGLSRADPPDRFARCVADRLADPAGGLALGASGRARIEQAYSWDAVTRHLAADVERWVGDCPAARHPLTSAVPV
jgi:glycosyltransferase involved in cell wall biosynthesis